MITLRGSYEDTEYEFTVGGIYNYEGSLCVFMPIEQLNRTFDLGNDYFSGYLSDSEITDIDEKYISSVIDLESLTKDFKTAYCINGQHDVYGGWFCDCHLYGCHLSAF